MDLVLIKNKIIILRIMFRRAELWRVYYRGR
jgi:hypothetical protein